jgi:hypothetical protein
MLFTKFKQKAYSLLPFPSYSSMVDRNPDLMPGDSGFVPGLIGVPRDVPLALGPGTNLATPPGDSGQLETTPVGDPGEAPDQFTCSPTWDTIWAKANAEPLP